MSIINPTVDTVAIGGLSILVLLFLLSVEPSWNQGQPAQRFVILTALLNWPHFMATYALMYRSSDTVERYPWASKWVPALLGAASVAAVVLQVVFESGIATQLLSLVAGAYLAWHYTGQAWGMMASFSYLGGAGIQDGERTWVRSGLRVLLAWHVIWFLHIFVFRGPPNGIIETFNQIYSFATYTLIPLGAILGIIGLVQYRNRIGRTPSLQVLVPFAAIVVWYCAMAINPFAIFWVQLSHALQYLLFPMRVEINRGVTKNRSPFRSVALFVSLALGLSLLVFELSPRVLAWVAPAGSYAVIKVAIGNFINIHHYFADGVLWKISNPAVRKELFSHLRGAETAN